MTFEDQLKILVFFHLNEHVSARHLLQVLEEDDFARELIAPPNGIKKSCLFEAINFRGLNQLQAVFENLCLQVSGILPFKHPEPGNLVALDGSLINATLSMHWADYRKKSEGPCWTLISIEVSHRKFISPMAKELRCLL